MKALQVIKPGDLQLVEREMPVIEKSDEVLIKVKAAGICGSDVHIYHGTSPVATYPRVIGHEFVGEVVEAGSAVDRVRVGDHVVIEPIVYCGHCYACRNGRPNVCENLEVIGVHRDGGFQEYFKITQDRVHLLSPSLDWKEAVLIEPFTIAAQVTWRGDVRPGDVVWIIGAGPAGLSILQYAKLKGAVCIVADVEQDKLDVAKGLGADHVILSSEVDPVEKVYEITEGMGANVVIDAACLPQTFEQAIQAASAAGRVVVMGFDSRPSAIAQFLITRRELTVVGSRLQTYKFPEVIEHFQEGRLKPVEMISHTFAFDDFKAAFDLIEAKAEKTSKVLLIFED